MPSALLVIFSHFLMEETLTFSHDKNSDKNSDKKLSTLKKIASINKKILTEGDLKFIEKAIKTS